MEHCWNITRWLQEFCSSSFTELQLPGLHWTRKPGVAPCQLKGPGLFWCEVLMSEQFQAREMENAEGEWGASGLISQTWKPPLISKRSSSRQKTRAGCVNEFSCSRASVTNWANANLITRTRVLQLLRQTSVYIQFTHNPRQLPIIQSLLLIHHVHQTGVGRTGKTNSGPEPEPAPVTNHQRPSPLPGAPLWTQPLRLLITLKVGHKHDLWSGLAPVVAS